MSLETIYESPSPLAAPSSTHTRLISAKPLKRRLFRRSRGIHAASVGLGGALFLFSSAFAVLVGLLVLSIVITGKALAAPAELKPGQVSLVSQGIEQVAAVTTDALDLNVTGPATKPITLEINAGTLLRLERPINTLFVANPEIADVQVKSPTLIYIHGKQPGETTLYAVDSKDRIIVNHRVSVGHNLTRLRSLFQTMRPNSGVQVASLEDTVVLTGTVASAEEAEEFVQLAAQMIGEGGALLNRMRVADPMQVNLRVRIAEVSRDVSKQLGFDYQVATSIGSTALNIATGTFLGGVASGTQQITGALSRGSTNLNFLLDALDQNGLITTLAEPNLTAQSGQTAHFLAGGEFPIPVPGDDGTVVIEFKQFGVGLSFLPVVGENGSVTIKIDSEVSQLSSAGAVSFNGFNVPSLTTRQAETTVALASGQSFAIAGLLQNTTNQNIDQFPGLGEIPVIGALFRSSEFQREESELIVIVTPYLVRPVSNRIAGPVDGYMPASEADRRLNGARYDQVISNAQPNLYDAEGRPGPVGRAGFILR